MNFNFYEYIVANLMDNVLQKAFLILFTIFSALTIEHFLMKYFFKKKSSLSLIFNNFVDSKIDIFCFIFYKFGGPVVRILGSITIPGSIILLYNVFLVEKFHYSGLVHIENSMALLIVYFLVADFGYYVAHVLMHKSNFLWRFHRVHHAAKNFNILVGNRITLSEHMFNNLVVLIFLVIFLGKLSLPDYAVIILFLKYIDTFQHSNLPINYWKLGYILASPQFHRFHHSKSKVDHDSNYGNLFSFWDYFFNTIGKRFVLDHKIASKVRIGL